MYIQHSLSYAVPNFHLNWLTFLKAMTHVLGDTVYNRDARIKSVVSREPVLSTRLLRDFVCLRQATVAGGGIMYSTSTYIRLLLDL